MDEALFLLINNAGTPALDDLWWLVTELGKGEYATGIAVILCVAALKRLPWDLIPLLLACAVVAGVLTEQIKHAVDRPRPLSTLGPKVRVVGEELRQRSFPSGHTSCAFALAVGGAARVSRRRAWAVGLVLAAAVGFSRIYVGAHYPLDVLAGALLGAACGAVLTLLDRWVRRVWETWRAQKWPPKPTV